MGLNRKMTLDAVKSILFSHEKRVVYVYTFSHVFTVFMAFLITLLFTNWMEPEIYGKYKYATNILLTLPTFFGFGIHFCVSRIVAEDKADESHPVVPISILLMLMVGFLISAGLLIITAIQSATGFGGNSAETLDSIRVVFPFLFVFTIKMLISQLYQGTGKIYQLSAYSAIQYAIVIAGVSIQYVVLQHITFKYCILLFIISHFFVQVPSLWRGFRKGLRGVRVNANRLFYDIKDFGLKIYLSSISTAGASGLIGLISGSIYGYEEYGYYALAISLAQFFTVISSSMAVVTFRKNVNAQYLSRSDLAFMYISNIIIYAVFSISINWLFGVFFLPKYMQAVLYLRILGVSYVISGMVVFYNRFFIARKLSHVILKNSLRVSVVNIVFSIILIPKFQILGLTIASALASIYNLLQYILAYKNYCKSLKRS